MTHSIVHHAMRTFPIHVILFMLLSVSFQKNTSAQTKTEVQILGADLLETITTDSLKLHRLAGNVRLQHKDLYMQCDSSLFFPTRNLVHAFGRVLIKQGDSLAISGDSLIYKGNKKLATLNGHVVLNQGDLQLTTTKLNYDRSKNVAYFNQKAFMKNANTTLESKSGKYYSDSRMAHFRKDVVLKNKNYVLTSDTLQYDTESDIAYFFGPTKIVSNDNIIHCERGWYNTRTELALFSKNVQLTNAAQKISADSLQYDRNLRYGQAYSNITWQDSIENVIINCHYAEYYELHHHVVATSGAVMSNIIDKDTLYLTADTIRSLEDTLIKITTLLAYHNVVVFKSNLQGICDSMVYTSKDSVMWFYQNPVMWSDSSQFTADTISVKLKNDKLHKINLRGTAFLATMNDTLVYNQVKGRTIIGTFTNDTLRQMIVNGNGENIYWAQDEHKAYMGVNKAVCSKMIIYMKKNKVDRISFTGEPEATLFPIKGINPAEYLLENFEWKGHLRPKSKEELFYKYYQIAAGDY